MTNISQSVRELLKKDVDRKEFLAHIGAAVVAVSGIAGIIKAVAEADGKAKPISGGYGASAYGGAAKPANVQRRFL
ncbi:MAG TPA: hypothetical protein VMT30_05055 [Candidatus Saccharimonadia bacterium]|nr:hypothetical protein [Candidatus Saccharimonadia bacterium]